MFHLGCLQTLLSPHLAVPLNENTDSHRRACGLGDRLVSGLVRLGITEIFSSWPSSLTTLLIVCEGKNGFGKVSTLFA